MARKAGFLGSKEATMSEENKKPETKIEAGELSPSELDNVTGGGILAGAAKAGAAGAADGAKGGPVVHTGSQTPPDQMPGGSIPDSWIG